MSSKKVTLTTVERGRRVEIPNSDDIKAIAVAHSRKTRNVLPYDDIDMKEIMESLKRAYISKIPFYETTDGTYAGPLYVVIYASSPGDIEIYKLDDESNFYLKAVPISEVLG